jgi:hypothetical protein
LRGKNEGKVKREKRKMKHVYMNPWVGKFYSKKGYFNKKILILGESQYCNECGPDGCYASIGNKCDSRTEIIERYLKYFREGSSDFEKWFNTYTKFANIFVGKKCDGKTKALFWDSVLFYNYVQENIAGPRVSPTWEMFNNNDNKEAFFEVIKKYDPDAIFTWGQRLWYNLPYEKFSGGRSILDKPSGFYDNGKRKIPIYFCFHPSSSQFDYTWSEYLKKAMGSAKRRLPHDSIHNE